MSITSDHGSWKKDHKKWLGDHKKWQSGHKKILRSIKTLEKAIKQHHTEMKKIGKYVKKHEGMMKKGSNGKHSNSMHKKFKIAHVSQNARHKLQHKACQQMLQVQKDIENAIKSLR